MSGLGRFVSLAVFSVLALPSFPQVASGQARAPVGGWTRPQAAHLLRRAGFGGAPRQVDYLFTMGRKAAVDYLVDYESIPDAPRRPAVERFEPADREEMRALSEDERQRIRQQRVAREQVQTHLLRRWWIERMVASPRPLEEKMTLFWHGHFTSGVREVRVAWYLWQQNELLRRHAVGNFRTLLMEISRDPAMLIYLNNAQNLKSQPNENYARELLELFTMGVGNYGERDVKEAARAFTGWSLDRDTGEFLFRRGQHDYGIKTVLGVRGNLNGGDVIDIILARPETADYIVRKLWRFFAGDEAPPGVARSLAATFRKNNYEIKPVLKAMFNHPAFYSPKVVGAAIKSPVELVVGTLRALEIRPVDLDGIVGGLRLMGQDLFQPPNVKGWDGGLNWITTATLYNRYNVTGRLVSGTDPRRRSAVRMMRRLAVDDAELREAAEPTGPQPEFDPMPIVRGHDLTTPEAVVEHFLDRLIGRPISPQRQAVLVEALQRQLPGGADVQSDGSADAIRELILLIVAMPEYQLS